MSRKTMCKIDSQKLKKLMEKTGKTYIDVSQVIGVGDSTFSNWMSKGFMPSYGVKLIELEFGIPYELYSWSESQPKQIAEPTDLSAVLIALGGLDSHLVMIYEELVRLNKELIGEKQEEENQ